MVLDKGQLVGACVWSGMRGCLCFGRPLTPRGAGGCSWRAEFDTVPNLLAKENGIFAGMAEASGLGLGSARGQAAVAAAAGSSTA